MGRVTFQVEGRVLVALGYSLPKPAYRALTK